MLFFFISNKQLMTSAVMLCGMFFSIFKGGTFEHWARDGYGRGELVIEVDTEVGNEVEVVELVANEVEAVGVVALVVTCERERERERVAK